jgi:hypothetical protein
MGSTYKDVADFLSVTESKIRTWMKKYPDFASAMVEGADIADADVTHALYKRATGYTHPEDKVFVYKGEVTVVPTIKHYPPDTAAIQFWLQARQRDKWAKPEDRQPDDQAINFNVILTPGHVNDEQAIEETELQGN